jgi:hypothetical protein
VRRRGAAREAQQGRVVEVTWSDSSSPARRASSVASRQARIASPGGCPRVRSLVTDRAATTPPMPTGSHTAQVYGSSHDPPGQRSPPASLQSAPAERPLPLIAHEAGAAPCSGRSRRLRGSVVARYTPIPDRDVVLVTDVRSAAGRPTRKWSGHQARSRRPLLSSSAGSGWTAGVPSNRTKSWSRGAFGLGRARSRSAAPGSL